MEKEYLYWLEKETKFLFGAPEARSIPVWAKSPEDGLAKLSSYIARGYRVKYLYPFVKKEQADEEQV